METKPFYESKTLWVNVIALIALLIQKAFGFELGAGEQITLLALVNIILRAYTGRPIEFSGKVFGRR